MGLIAVLLLISCNGRLLKQNTIVLCLFSSNPSLMSGLSTVFVHATLPTFKISSSNPLLIGALSVVTTILTLRYLNDGSQSFKGLESEAYPSQLGPWAVQEKGKQTMPLEP